MITQLQARNFKSWRDTTLIRMAPLAGLFGPNSSGKTALLQILLMLKQTVESADRSRVLHTGDDRTYVDLGTFYDVVYQHQIPGDLHLTVEWELPAPLRILNPEKERDQTLFSVPKLELGMVVEGTEDSIAAVRFAYSFGYKGLMYKFGMQREATRRAIAEGQPEYGSTYAQNDVSRAARQRVEDAPKYELISAGYTPKRARGRPVGTLPPPVKGYGFPDQVFASYQNVGFLSEFVLALEQLFQHTYYLGPLREYPHRSYIWAGEQPQDVGRRGELAVPALLATRKLGRIISRGRSRHKQTVEERVAEWLKELGLIESFALRQIAENRKEYEVRVRRTSTSAEVLITDVGFGVSQILPVLVLCYYAPEGSTIILEQPEIHLHPAVQAGLADVFIDAIKNRHVQIVLESHSEHLLRRLQRRIAEGVFPCEQAALYFVRTGRSASELQRLELDLYGNIVNWPPDFFGDEMGELAAMTEAAMRKKVELAGKP